MLKNWLDWTPNSILFGYYKTTTYYVYESTQLLPLPVYFILQSFHISRHGYIQFLTDTNNSIQHARTHTYILAWELTCEDDSGAPLKLGGIMSEDSTAGGSFPLLTFSSINHWANANCSLFRKPLLRMSHNPLTSQNKLISTSLSQLLAVLSVKIVTSKSGVVTEPRNVTIATSRVSHCNFDNNHY